MIQCFTCLYTVMHNQPKGKGLCRLTNKVHDVLSEHKCKQWKLAPMDMVRVRTKRNITFDNNGIAELL